MKKNSPASLIRNTAAKQANEKSSIFIHPRGYIDLVFTDGQSNDSIIYALKQLKILSKKLAEKKQPILIFVDASHISNVNMGEKMKPARIEAVKTISLINFKKAAVCAPLPVQIIVNTIALVAGKRNKVKVFENQAAAKLSNPSVINRGKLLSMKATA
jgi:hypothetical protein